ncbi:MAG: ABC-F family ATP-binding cassette domain-containing protein [Candidatus Nomurabacteria bacterium]|mgnify:CR=1 FL=1|nr:MAG: ABC-F family ATP-binding cassette domain-containing protein [Candidatus Nomurabacteria bacterium]HRV75923.1 ABC-F family ATP-binding cassette domain-containing protein [Candidatus Saccharimonadales bacterium]
MFVIDIDNLDFSFESSEDKLFEELDLNLNSGEIVGLVGPNGSGKSTLMKLIIGELSPNAGQIRLKTPGYLPQEVDLGNLNKSLKDLFEARFGADEWRGELALDISGLTALNIDSELKSLSGGQKTRLGLGLILAGEDIPECLLLDEPTNNLDSEGLEWLKRVLEDYRGGVLIASHERVFLDDVVESIVAIEDKKLASYGGGYSSYREQLEAKQKAQEDEYLTSLSEKKKLESYIGTNKQRVNKVSSEKFDKTKHEGKMGFNTKRSWSEAGLGRKIKAAHSKLDQLDEVAEPNKVPVLDVRLDAVIPRSKIVLRLNDLNKSFAQKGVIADFSLEVRGPERLLVSGQNGSGKSTLLSIIVGKLSADSGDVELGEGLTFGYFSQDVYGLDQFKTPLEELNNLEKDKARCYLLCIKAGLSKQSADKKISELSRGQQAKLGFVKLMLTQPDVLVIDEPTNHLDMQTKEAIENALKDFGGAIILASHDKYFVEKLAISRFINLQ